MDDGNAAITTYNPAVSVDELGSVWLKRKSDGRKTNIGTLKLNRQRVPVYNKFENQILHKLNAFGFCKEFIMDFSASIIKVTWIGGSEVQRGTYTLGIIEFKRQMIELPPFTNTEVRVFVPVDKFKFRRER